MDLSLLRCLLLFAPVAQRGPRHRLQASLGDRLPACLADTKRSRPYSRERIFDLLVQGRVGCMQLDLELCCDIGTGLIHKVASLVPRRRNESRSFVWRRQLVSLGEQEVSSISQGLWDSRPPLQSPFSSD